MNHHGMIVATRCTGLFILKPHTKHVAQNAAKACVELQAVSRNTLLMRKL